jgi:hypothetical protein
MIRSDENSNSAPCEPARFGIPSHIHVCVTSAGAVILDVKKDRYLGLGREETEVLADVVAGWPEPLWARSICHKDPENLKAIKATCKWLLEEGVLERISEAGQARSGRAPKDMRGEWISIGDEFEVQGRVTLRYLGRFVSAYCWARSSLACRPFSAVVEEVKAKRLQRERECGQCHPWAVAALVDVFRRLRPFVFAAEGRCLLHALTLIRFLSLNGFYPDWVIGVTTQPWGAHSWVQWGNFLLDSNPEKVCAFTPILVV